MKNSKKCDQISNKIFSNNLLTLTDEQEIKEHISYCSVCKNLFLRTKQINYLINDHIGDEILIVFSTIDNNSNMKTLSEIEVSRITWHLRNCAICQKKYETFKSQYIEMTKFWDDSGYPDFEFTQIVKEKDNSSHLKYEFLTKGFKRSRLNKIAFPLAAAITILILSTMIKWNKVSLEDFSQIEDTKIPISIRGSAEDDLQKGIIVFNQKKYSEAIILFQQYLKENDNGNSEYIKYLLAYSYLKNALEDNNINKNFIDLGILELVNILASTNNQNLKENVLWLLAKAYLLKEDQNKAKEYLIKIVEMNGSRAEKSQDIINQLW